MSESLISLTKNERLSELLIFLSELLIHSFLDKNERFARKSNEQIHSPAVFYFILQSYSTDSPEFTGLKLEIPVHFYLVFHFFGGYGSGTISPDPDICGSGSATLA